MRHLSLFLLGALAGCAATPPQESGGSLAGHLVMAPRMQVFVPCHAQEPLWVVVDDALREQLFTRYAELVDEPGEEAFAQVRGTVAGAGLPVVPGFPRQLPSRSGARIPGSQRHGLPLSPGPVVPVGALEPRFNGSMPGYRG